MKKRISK